MAKLNTYLNFYSRCTEAMNLYRNIFGGELQLMLAGDSPAKDQMPPELHKQVLHIGFLAFKPYIAAFIMSFIISFPTGFLLMRYIVFPDSSLHGRIQFLRYFLLVVICILMNYIFIRLFVEIFHIYPTIAKIITTGIVVFFSYLMQKNFTFKKHAGAGSGITD